MEGAENSEYYNKKVKELRGEQGIEQLCKWLTDLAELTGASHISLDVTAYDDNVKRFNTVFVSYGDKIAIRHSKEAGWCEGIFQEARTIEK